MDQYLFTAIKEINTNIFTLSNCIVFGLVIIMLSSIYTYSAISHKKNFVRTVLFLIPILIFVVINNHEFCYRLFIAQGNNEKFLGITTSNPQFFIHTYSIIVFTLYLFIPFVALFNYCKDTTIKFLHDNAIISAFCFILIDAFIVFTFYLGTTSALMPWKIDLNKFPIGSIVYSSSQFILPNTILTGVVVIVLSIKFKPIGSLTILTRRKTNKNFVELNHSLRMVFHINKNILFTIEKLSEQSINNFDNNPELTRENLKNINSASSKGLQTLTHMLLMLDDIKADYSPISLKKCILLAADNASFPKSIEFEFENKCKDAIINSSEIHMTEMFVNLFKNSIESIEQKKIQDGKVIVTLSVQKNFALIEIYDNGMGIEKENIKNVFSVLYSTKHSFKNWGIGLSYVKKIVDVYNGTIYIKSEPNEYTNFQIVLPIGKDDI